MFAPETKEEQAARHRAEGRSEQEIAYFQAENQKDYEPILKDPNTPEKVISDIVDRITLVPLKVLAFKHPNISSRSQRYMIEKADKKKYQKELIEAYWSNPKFKFEDVESMLKYYNTANRFVKFTTELIEENKSFTSEQLAALIDLLCQKGTNFELMLAILKHKSSDIKVFTSTVVAFAAQLADKTGGLAGEIQVLMKKHKNYTAEAAEKLYTMTGNDVWLPDEVKELFIF